LTPATFPNLKVIELLSVNGAISMNNWNAIKSVVLEVPAAQAPVLLQALAIEGTVIEYSQLSEKATVTPVPTATENPPTPLATPTILPDWTYLRLPIEGISQLENFNLTEPVDGRLVVVYKEANETVVFYATEQFCVQVAAFLDENGENARITLEKKTSKELLLLLRVDDLARYGKAMAGKSQILLAPDSSCSTVLQ
jgi:hypothetical protein